MTDKKTELENAKEKELTSAFVGLAFGGKCSFPKLGEMAMLYAEFKISPPK